jgi:hypothetical protein
MQHGSLDGGCRETIRNAVYLRECLDCIVIRDPNELNGEIHPALFSLAVLLLLERMESTGLDRYLLAKASPSMFIL